MLRLADDGALEPDSVGAITESVAPLEFFGAMTTTYNNFDIILSSFLRYLPRTPRPSCRAMWPLLKYSH